MCFMVTPKSIKTSTANLLADDIYGEYIESTTHQHKVGHYLTREC